MRLNKFLAAGSDLSRRKADDAIRAGRVSINGQPAAQGAAVTPEDIVKLDGRVVDNPGQTTTIILNKPRGYVVSRDGQGSRTIYDLLPPAYQRLNPVGRLDKESSGLLVVSDDGKLTQELTHPSRRKQKIYHVTLDLPLQPLHRQMISDHGLQLEDGPSRLLLERHAEGDDRRWIVTMHEGRNRQIRRTFAALGYEVVSLHRTQFGPYILGDLPSGQIAPVDPV